ncbi:M28 family peptidase [Croceicoccus bisphenolivorans]|uniref:M28 family peptidase n=1 Tax=Croceicoccus bisphenolivorans TaxID=1783232 RepID=UPI00082B8C67|nr:M28 family peptidase [Croceicoccus bisphenolivorans]
MRILSLAAASLLLASCTATNTTSGPKTAPSAPFIEGDIRYLASDALDGRKAGTAGFDAASDYVAQRFAAIGLKPGGTDGTWFQPVDLRIKSYGAIDGNVMELSGPNAPDGLEANEDYIVTAAGNALSGTVEAPLVFVGQGFVDPRTGRDDLAGVDLEGKIAVALSGAPEYLDPEELAYFKSTRIDRLADAGAVGVISLSLPKDDKPAAWKGTKDYYHHYTLATWIGPDGTAFGRKPAYRAYATIRPESAEKFLAKQPVDLKSAFETTNTREGRFRPFDMGVTAKMTFDQKLRDVTSRNVVGMVEGTDPQLKNEYVVLTAHLDHIGHEPAGAEGDAINNGAMDNASGVAIMLDVARRLAANPPRRSVLFVALTAEEMGLVGSAYNARFPTVPAGSIVANVNMDMPMVTYPFSDIIAYGAERTTMFPVVRAAARRAGVTLAADPKPEEAFFTRSDHYSYVETGVPSVYLDTGPGNGGDKALDTFLEEHYHKVSDEAEVVDFEQAARFAGINYEIARGIANMGQRPVWKKDDFFGTVFGGRMED